MKLLLSGLCFIPDLRRLLADARPSPSMHTLSPVLERLGATLGQFMSMAKTVRLLLRLPQHMVLSTDRFVQFLIPIRIEILYARVLITYQGT